ncbi:MAG: M20/M25/M40 family metallo-hydrolase [Anaerolineae bacterium]|nr:M20/M25/M40 family metallo-hydrolase [Anaerolineae bacterium]
MYNVEAFEAYLAQHRARFLQEFASFIAVPSVAAQQRSIPEMADLVAERFAALGATVQQYPLAGGSPVVYAEIGSGPRTLMIYNHYDVQPETPVELWDSPPFELTQRDGKLIGRGVSDDKGELLARIQAVEAWLATQGDLPLRIKWVVEGEEEIGSVNLEEWVKEHAAMLSADGILWEGGGYDEAGRITIGAGCKGIAYFDLRVRGANQDLHSSLAPVVVNPAWRLVWALSTIKNEADEITIDGYMDHVRPLTADEIRSIDAVPFEAEAFKENYGLDEFLNGMDARAANRRLYEIPTATICGLDSGYQGPGSKTVLPAEAMAKIDFRLVPNLTPELVERLLREHLDRRGFTDVEIIDQGGENPARSALDTPLHEAAIAASQQTWNKQPVMVPWFAGSGPMYPLSTMLDIPVVSAGAMWHPQARAHSPNENIFEADYFSDMHYTASLLAHFAIT